MISRLTDQLICIIWRFHTHRWCLVILVDTSLVLIIYIFNSQQWYCSVHIRYLCYFDWYLTIQTSSNKCMKVWSHTLWLYLRNFWVAVSNILYFLIIFVQSRAMSWLSDHFICALSDDHTPSDDTWWYSRKIGWYILIFPSLITSHRKS